MEAASKNGKRGRPNVWAQHGLDDIRAELLLDKGKRTTQNELYIMDAISAIERLAPTGCERLYFIPDNIMSVSRQECLREGYKRDSTILEQLGRVLTQDGLSDDDFVTIAEKAAEYKEQGYTSKEIAQWIRQVRANVKATEI